MPDDEKLRQAATVALRDVMAVKEGERVLIITNLGGDVFEIAQELFRQAEAMKARPVIVVQQDKDAFTFADQAVLDAVKAEPDVVISVGRGRLGKDPYGMQVGYIGRDGQTYKHIFNKVLYGDKHIRSFWSPNVTRDIFERSVNIDYEALRKKACVLKEVVDAGSSVRVTSPAGTDITFSIADRKGHYDDGDFRSPGQGGNLPAGEVYMSPSNGTASGLIVFDGTVDLDKQSEFPDQPVHVRYVNGYVSEITGGSTAKKLQDIIDRSEAMAREKGMKEEEKNARHLGELGIGLNPAARMVANTLEDEKVGGTVHFAIGMNLENDANALNHLDCLVLQPDLYIDGKKIMEKGKLLL